MQYAQIANIKGVKHDVSFFCRMVHRYLPAPQCQHIALELGATEQIFTILSIGHIHIGEQIDHITKHTLVKVWTCVILRQNILQSLVLVLDSSHSIINDRANFRRMGGSGHHRAFSGTKKILSIR